MGKRLIRFSLRKISRVLAAGAIITLFAIGLKKQATANSLLINQVAEKIGIAPPAISLGNKDKVKPKLLPTVSYGTLKPSDIKPYTGSAYIFVNSGNPFFTQKEIDAAKEADYEAYEGFDKLGRTKAAWMVVTHHTAVNDERADISGIHPSGWNQSKYDESIVQDGWIWNRCHLLMHAAGGDDIPENLITGTQYMNTEGMWGVEQTVYYHAKENPGARVLYRVTPLYEGDELIARGVLMEAYSLEDDGKSVKFAVYCYNVQPYTGIDYGTGKTFQKPTI